MNAKEYACVNTVEGYEPMRVKPNITVIMKFECNGMEGTVRITTGAGCKAELDFPTGIYPLELGLISKIVALLREDRVKDKYHPDRPAVQ